MLLSGGHKINNHKKATRANTETEETANNKNNQFKKKHVCVPVAQAHVVFKPTLQQQRKCANCTDSAIDGTFTVVYDVNREGNTGELQVGGASWFQREDGMVSFGPAVTAFVLQVSDGHFVQFFAPANLSPLPKNIVFVIDVSGSMWGVKMKQVWTLHFLKKNHNKKQ